MGLETPPVTRISFFIFLLAALLLLWGDSPLLAFPPITRAEMRVARAQQASRNVSESEEYRVGRAVAARILSNHPLAQDPRLQLYVNEVGQTVARKSYRPKTYRRYHFEGLESLEATD